MILHSSRALSVVPCTHYSTYSALLIPIPIPIPIPHPHIPDTTQPVSSTPFILSQQYYHSSRRHPSGGSIAFNGYTPDAVQYALLRLPCPSSAVNPFDVHSNQRVPEAVGTCQCPTTLRSLPYQYYLSEPKSFPQSSSPPRYKSCDEVRTPRIHCLAQPTLGGLTYQISKC